MSARFGDFISVPYTSCIVENKEENVTYCLGLDDGSSTALTLISSRDDSSWDEELEHRVWIGKD